MIEGLKEIRRDIATPTFIRLHRRVLTITHPIIGMVRIWGELMRLSATTATMASAQGSMSSREFMEDAVFAGAADGLRVFEPSYLECTKTRRAA